MYGLHVSVGDGLTAVNQDQNETWKEVVVVVGDMKTMHFIQTDELTTTVAEEN